MDMIPADIQATQAALSQSSGVYFEPQFKIHRPLKKNEYSLPLDSFTASGANSDWFYRASKSGGVIVSTNAKQNKKTQNDKNSEYTISLIEKIQGTFNLSVEETDTICGVTRKTLYNWKDGDSPRKSKFKRLIDVAFIADYWKSSSLSSDRALLEQPFYKNRSIMELLADKHLDKDTILFVGSRMQLDSINDAAPIEDPFA
jgi:DNA-binding transcriptional regulator YiaG